MGKFESSYVYNSLNALAMSIGLSVTHCHSVNTNEDRIVRFLQRDAISTVYAVMRCPSVRLSVLLSVTFVYCIEMSNSIFKNFNRTEEKLIVRTGKSEAEVTNNYKKFALNVLYC